MKVRLFRKNRKRGQIPGTLESPREALPSVVQVFAYSADQIEEAENCTVEQIAALRKKWPMIWVNVSGLANAALVEGLGTLFNLHPLALEDVLHTPQRPKVDEYEDNIFVIVRMVEQEKGSQVLDQLSLFWGAGFVISFQERPGDTFNPIRERLRKGGKRIKMSHADYMAYALMDSVVDGYFPVLEHYGDQLDALEEKILYESSRDTMKELHRTKRDLHVLRLCLWPMRDSISKLRAGSDFVREETHLYLRDAYDHIIQILDIIESYRERVSALNDLYLSSVNYKLNEVMKVLTIITTIFMPLSFIAGIYGMNFDTTHPYNMPELLSPYGYPAVLLFMLLIAIGMMVYFWRVGWIGGGEKKSH
jgi:magnesium transporter